MRAAAAARATRLGVVYTPPEVARPRVELALAPLADGRTAAQLLALRVCDPALGEGAFLVEVVEVLGARVHAAWAREGHADTLADARAEVARRCIAGVDVDAAAVAAARARLGDDDAAADDDADAAAAARRAADALELDWAAAFPDVFGAARGGFDAILANPPYVRQEHLERHKPALRGYASYDGVADLYVYFIELAHRLARPGGRYCLITPSKWLTAAYGRALRSFLAARGTVEGIADVARAPVFAGADAFPCIVHGTVAAAPSRGPIRAVRDATSVAAALAAPGAPHARARWTAEPWHIDAAADRALIDRLERAWPALGDVVPARPARGVVTGCNEAFVVDAATRARLVAGDPACARWLRPLLKGRDLRPWIAAPATRWLVLVDRGTELAALPAPIAAHLARYRAALEPRPAAPAAHAEPWPGRKPGSYRWYELQDPVGAHAASRAPRLFYQDIQTAPACCLDPSGEHVPDTTVWILPTGDRFLLALLNSPLYHWYARRRFPPALNGAVRPKLEYLRALPIAAPAPAARAALDALVDRRLAGDASVTAAIAGAVADAYALSPRERALIGSDR